MAYWWVNHKQTRDHEVGGGYLWSPYRNTNGAFNQTYENMKLVSAGDAVFSYAHGLVGAVGRVTEVASPSLSLLSLALQETIGLTKAGWSK